MEGTDSFIQNQNELVELQNQLQTDQKSLLKGHVETRNVYLSLLLFLLNINNIVASPINSCADLSRK